MVDALIGNYLYFKDKSSFSVKKMVEKKRCGWVPLDNPLYVKYHDEEWGVPVHDDRLLFEFLLLEGFQAGLSWITILRKRENYRRAFDNFDAKKIEKYDEKKIEKLMQDSGMRKRSLKCRRNLNHSTIISGDLLMEILL